ncbi:TPA: GNAT family N-acetyltransferase [Vibrio diabolicus]|nr:GNAT family N-acetyltransferase [Vibrio vulnificus]
MQQVLETERLILRSFELSDATQVSVLAGDERIAEMTANIPHPYEVSDAISWIETHENGFTSGESIVYAIVHKESLELIGAVSLPRLKDGQGILGYWLGVDFWGRGYATEASKALIAYAKERHGLTELKVMHLVGNDRSKSVINKLGVAYIENQTLRMQGGEQEVCVYISAV